MLFKPAILIFFFFLFFYFGTPRLAFYTDTVIAAVLPVSIIRGSGFDLKELYPSVSKIIPSKAGQNDFPYYVINKNGHLFSAFPVFSSVLAVPVYLFPVIFKNITPESLQDRAAFFEMARLGKFSASLFCAISISFVYLSARRFLKIKKSIILVLVYALATSTLPISSQSLWQHAASQMLIAISIYLLIAGRTQKKLIPLCGLILGLAVLSRFPNIIIAVLFTLYIYIYERKRFTAFILYTLPAIIFLAWYQLTYPGNLFFYKYEALGDMASFNNNFLGGFFGLLIAPSKGLLIYSPVFVFALWGGIQSFLKKQRLFIFFSVICITYIMFISSWSAWHGAWSYGPRMLTDITPFFTLLMVLPLKQNKLWKKIPFKLTFILLLILSICIQFLGAIRADFSWYQMRTQYLPANRIHETNFLWDIKYPEIYSFYLASGGIFGVIYMFYLALKIIFASLARGFLILLMLQFILWLSKKIIIKANIKLSYKFLRF